MKNITRFLRLALTVLFIFSLSITMAGTITSIATGNWYSTTTWDCNCAPTAAHDVIIAAFHTVTLTDVASVKSVVINANGILALADGTDILTITIDFTISGTCSTAGTIFVGNDINNTGTLSGGANGTICVANISTNTGALTGTLDFCDATPPPNTPFIDNNSGPVGTSVTFCQTGLCSGSGIIETGLTFTIDVYPNPAQDYTIVKVESVLGESLTLVIYDILGREVRRVHGNSNEEIVIERNQLSDGLYFISVQDGDQVIGTSKLLLE